MSDFNIEFDEAGTLKWSKAYEVNEGFSFKVGAIVSPTSGSPIISVGLTCLDSNQTLISFHPTVWDQEAITTAFQTGQAEVLVDGLPTGTKFIQLTLIVHNNSEGLIHNVSLEENTIEANARTFKDQAVVAKEETEAVRTQVVQIQGEVATSELNATNAATAAATSATTAESAATTAGSNATITETNKIAVQALYNDTVTEAAAAVASAATAQASATDAGQFAAASDNSRIQAETARAGAENAETNSAASATTADSARSAAESARDLAVTAQNNAGNSATAAAGHSSTAQAAADDAEGFSTAANTSATQASTFRNEANTFRNEASTFSSSASSSSSSAAASATSAANSATAAAGSASTASSQSTLADNARVAAEAARDVAVDTVNGLSGRVTTVEGVLARADNLEAWFENRTSVNGVPGTFIEARTVLSGGAITSDVSIGALSIVLYNQANAAWIKAMEITGGNAVFYGDLSALGSMLFGSRRIPVALQSFQVGSLSDGDNLDYGGDLTNIPDFIADTTTLAPLTAGEQYDVRLINQSSTGSTLFAKIITPAGTTNYNSAGQTNGGGSNPDRLIDKGHVADASDGSYTFTVTYTGDINLGESPFYWGIKSFEFFVRPNATGSWISLGTEAFNPVRPSSGLQTLTAVSTKNYGSAIGNVSGWELGVSMINKEPGEAITNVLVQWTATTQSASRTASPNGETCRVTILPRNA